VSASVVNLRRWSGLIFQLRATRRTQFDRSLDHCYLCLDPLIQVVLRGRFRSDRALAVMERKIHALSQERKFCKVDPSSNRP
jgi:hypothetical protein